MDGHRQTLVQDTAKDVHTSHSVSHLLTRLADNQHAEKWHTLQLLEKQLSFIKKKALFPAHLECLANSTS